MTPEPQGPAPQRARRRETTRQSILRFKEMVQRRMAAVNDEFNQERAVLNASETHAEMRASDLLIRTLGKVIELERKERDTRTARAKKRRVLTAGRREELAKRIEALAASGTGDESQRAPDAG